MNKQTGFYPPGYLSRAIYLLLLAMLVSCKSPAPAPPTPCSEAWNQQLETTLGTGDGMGHGPDIGSQEWQSVIEFKLGIRGRADVPERGSKDWCEFIDAQLKAK